MPRASASKQSLVFRGPPQRLQLQGAFPDLNSFEIKSEKRLQPYLENSRHRAFKINRNKQGEPRVFRGRLDRHTPPGTYKLEFISGKKSIPADIHVEPRPRVSMQPAQLSFVGAPGNKIRLHALFSNKGNLPFEIKAKHTLGIFDDDGLENAFATIYRSEEKGIEKLLEKFLDKLRDSHGGLLKLRVIQGHGTLAPASHQAVVIEAQIPSGLKPGHSYHGVWSTPVSDYSVTVTVTK